MLPCKSRTPQIGISPAPGSRADPRHEFAFDVVNRTGTPSPREAPERCRQSRSWPLPIERGNEFAPEGLKDGVFHDPARRCAEIGRRQDLPSARGRHLEHSGQRRAIARGIQQTRPRRTAKIRPGSSASRETCAFHGTGRQSARVFSSVCRLVAQPSTDPLNRLGPFVNR